MIKMPQILCPRCIQRVTYDFDTKDIIHECNSGNEVLDQEDKVVVSSTSEEFGATVDTNVKPSAIMLQGIVNKFQGTIAGIEGENFDGVTRRGANATTNRQRQHYEFIELGGKKNE